MYSRTVLAYAALACAVGLSGCGPRGAGDGQAATTASGYCTAFRTTNAAGAQNSAVADPSGALDDCIHRWAYVLSRGHDPADVVAHATLEACSANLAAWSQQAAGASQQDQGGQSPRYDRRGEAGGEATPNPMAQQMGMVDAKALFYVVQARAGNCELPPASSLPALPVPG
jgi:hypothetical protein